MSGLSLDISPPHDILQFSRGLSTSGMKNFNIGKIQYIHFSDYFVFSILNPCLDEEANEKHISTHQEIYDAGIW